MSAQMSGSVSSFEAAPALRLARMEKLLRDLQFNKDYSVNATLLAQHFNRANQEYEKANSDYHQELCSRYSCCMGDLIKEGTRGRVTKGAEPGCNARRYCQELALHFAQWADPLLAADMQEALQLLISGQITTEASVNAAVSLAAAAHIGRSKAGALDDNLQLEGIVDGMGSLGLLPPLPGLSSCEGQPEPQGSGSSPQSRDPGPDRDAHGAKQGSGEGFAPLVLREGSEDQ